MAGKWRFGVDEGDNQDGLHMEYARIPAVRNMTSSTYFDPSFLRTSDPEECDYRCTIRVLAGKQTRYNIISSRLHKPTIRNGKPCNYIAWPKDQAGRCAEVWKEV